MNLESRLPQAALEDMEKNFGDLTPVISEQNLIELCSDEPNLENLLESFLNYAIRYAEDVWNMHTYILEGGIEKDPDKFAEIDENRTRLHNALVDSIGILSRNMVKNNINIEWVRDLTNGNTLERAACGKFALLLVYRRYLDNRAD